MNWRKSSRWLHRRMGYLFFGMAIIYGISGIALNHHITRHWNPSLVERTETLYGPGQVNREDVSEDYIRGILEITGETANYKQYFFPSDNTLLIYLNKGHITVDLESGECKLVKIRNRRVFLEMNFLHYNKPKQLWTYFSDLFGLSLVLLSVTGLYMVKGKHGIKGPGGILLAIGIIVPLIFLIIYLW
ncbi:MAG: PepSY-associated TM helix domain-containing protein [Bacteroidales bacterium]